MQAHNKSKRVLFWTILVIIPLIFMEIAIRGWDFYRGRGSERYLIPHTKFLGYQSHPFLSYMLRPNSMPHHKKYRINSAGFKSDREISEETPENTIRIFCMGGSTTYDGEHNDPGTYPGKLEKLLSERYPSKNFEVINAGVPSYTVLENMINLQIRLLDYDPDIVIYYGGANSARVNLTFSDLYESDQTHFRRSFPTDDWFDEQHHWWLSILEESRLFLFLRYKLTNYKDKMYIHHYIFTVPIKQIAKSNHISQKGLIAFERELRNIVAISQEHGISPVLCTFTWNKDFPKDVGGNPLFIPCINQQNEIVRNICFSKGIPLADVNRFFPNEDGLFVDDFHLSEKGNEHLARIIFDTIKEHGLVK